MSKVGNFAWITFGAQSYAALDDKTGVTGMNCHLFQNNKIHFESFFERMKDIFDRYIRRMNEDDWYTHFKIIETCKMVLLNAIRMAKSNLKIRICDLDTRVGKYQKELIFSKELGILSKIIFNLHEISGVRVIVSFSI